MIMCKNNAFISLLWTPNIALLFGIPSSTLLLSAFIQQQRASPACCAVDSPLSRLGLRTNLHLLCHSLPLILQNISFWSVDCFLHSPFFSLARWSVPLSLSGPKDRDLMWQLFLFHSDGSGRKRWANFPDRQQRAGFPSASVNWLFPSILIYFF